MTRSVSKDGFIQLATAFKYSRLPSRSPKRKAFNPCRMHWCVNWLSLEQYTSRRSTPGVWVPSKMPSGDIQPCSWPYCNISANMGLSRKGSLEVSVFSGCLFLPIMRMYCWYSWMHFSIMKPWSGVTSFTVEWSSVRWLPSVVSLPRSELLPVDPGAWHSCSPGSLRWVSDDPTTLPRPDRSPSRWGPDSAMTCHRWRLAWLWPWATLQNRPFPPHCRCLCRGLHVRVPVVRSTAGGSGSMLDFRPSRCPPTCEGTTCSKMHLPSLRRTSDPAWLARRGLSCCRAPPSIFPAGSVLVLLGSSSESWHRNDLQGLASTWHCGVGSGNWHCSTVWAPNTESWSPGMFCEGCSVRSGTDASWIGLHGGTSARPSGTWPLYLSSWLWKMSSSLIWQLSCLSTAVSVRGGRRLVSAQKSSRNSFFPESSNGSSQLSFWKKIHCRLVSMMAPRLRQTLLEIRNGVRVSTMAILIQNLSTGINMARLQGTTLLFPKRNDISTGRSCTSLWTSVGRLSRNSRTWCLPMTVCEAPKSTIPMAWVVANKATSVAVLVSVQPGSETRDLVMGILDSVESRMQKGGFICTSDFLGEGVSATLTVSAGLRSIPGVFWRMIRVIHCLTWL